MFSFQFGFYQVFMPQFFPQKILLLEIFSENFTCNFYQYLFRYSIKHFWYKLRIALPSNDQRLTLLAFSTLSPFPSYLIHTSLLWNYEPTTRLSSKYIYQAHIISQHLIKHWGDFYIKKFVSRGEKHVKLALKKFFKWESGQGNGRFCQCGSGKYLERHLSWVLM